MPLQDRTPLGLVCRQIRHADLEVPRDFELIQFRWVNNDSNLHLDKEENDDHYQFQEQEKQWIMTSKMNYQVVGSNYAPIQATPHSLSFFRRAKTEALNIMVSITVDGYGKPGVRQVWAIFLYIVFINYTALPTSVQEKIVLIISDFFSFLLNFFGRLLIIVDTLQMKIFIRIHVPSTIVRQACTLSLSEHFSTKKMWKIRSRISKSSPHCASRLISTKCVYAGTIPLIVRTSKHLY